MKWVDGRKRRRAAAQPSASRCDLPILRGRDAEGYAGCDALGDHQPKGFESKSS
jgi:hypothetical protein